MKDTWFFGAGPYRRGSIQRESEFAGEALPKIPSALHVFPEETAPRATEIKPEKEPARAATEVPLLPGFGTTLFGFERPLLGPTRPTVATRSDPPTPRVLPPEIVGPPWPETPMLKLR